MAGAVFCRIGEVAEALGVAPHVLRYWEQELPLRLSDRNRGGHRVYSEDDVDKLTRVKRLVVDQGVSVRKLRRIVQVEGLPELGLPAEPQASAAPTLREIVDELTAIRRLLD